MQKSHTEKMSELNSISQKRCFYCPRPSVESCPDCELISYCSPEHRAFHRPKKRCFLFKVEKSEEKGLLLVAARDIKANEVIMEEYPAAVGPYLKTMPQCLTCFSPVSLDFVCENCGFPMCDEECAKDPLHVDNECGLFVKAGKKVKVEVVDKPCDAYAVISPLRSILLKDKSPQLWKSFQQLSDHCEIIRESDISSWNKNQTRVVKVIQELTNNRFTAKEINRVVCLMNINNVNLCLTDGKRGTGLYCTYARMNHGCVCNTKSIKFKDQKLEVRAACPIRKGEEICNQYVKPHNCSVVRRPLLRKKWHFDCRCKRCRDPTEMGSFLSAILCKKCKGGAVLSKDPLKENSWWQCRDCEQEYSVEHVKFVIDEFRECLEGDDDDEEEEEDVVENGVDEDDEEADDDEDDANNNNLHSNIINKYEEIIHKFSDRVHPSHQTMIELQTHLAHLYGNVKPFMMEDLTRPMLNRKIQVCNQVLETLGKVDPGYSSWRGKMLVELTKAKVALAKRNLAGGIITKTQFMKVLQEEKFLGVYLAYYHSIFFRGQ